MALCGRLGDMECIMLFEGSRELAWSIHATLLPDVGEFYALQRLCIIQRVLELTTRRLPLPPLSVLRPQKRFLNWLDRRRERMICCMASTDLRSKWITNYMKCGHNTVCRGCRRELPMRWDLLSSYVRANHAASCMHQRRRPRWRKLAPNGAVKSSIVSLGDLSTRGFGDDWLTVSTLMQGHSVCSGA